MRPEASAGPKDIWLAKTTAGNSGDRSNNLRNHCESAPLGNHWNPSRLAMLHAVRGSRPKNLRNHSKSAPPGNHWEPSHLVMFHAVRGNRSKNLRNHSESAPPGNHWNPSHLAMLYAVRGNRPKNLRNHSKSAPPALLSAREKNEKSWSRWAPGGGQCSGAFAPSKRRSRGDSSDILVVVLGYLFICRAVSRF